MKSIIELQKGIDLFDESLNKLNNEADKLFDVLDKASAAVLKLEASLIQQKNFISFKIPVQTTESEKNPPKEVHYRKFGMPEGYHIETTWYLSWEPEDEFKNRFRLYLIIDAKEVVGYWHEESVLIGVHRVDQKYKKAFTDAPWTTRIQFIEHIVPFVTFFEEHLRSYRVSIEAKSIPPNLKNNPFSDLV